MKSPSFQFYVRDWLCSLTVQRMTGDQVKAYLYLLCASWLEHPRATLPNDDSELAMLSRLTLEQWMKIKDGVLRCFVLRDNRWVSERLAVVSNNQLKKVNAGHLGGENARGKSGRKPQNPNIFSQSEIPKEIAKQIPNEIAKHKADTKSNGIYAVANEKNIGLAEKKDKKTKRENLNENEEIIAKEIAEQIPNSLANPISKEYPSSSTSSSTNINTVKESKDSLFSNFKDFYLSWFLKTQNFKCSMKAQDGAALKKIISYFKQDSENDEKTFEKFKEIFDNWHKLDTWLQDNATTLTMIYSQLNKILIQIKNGKTNGNGSLNGNGTYIGSASKDNKRLENIDYSKDNQ